MSTSTFEAVPGCPRHTSLVTLTHVGSLGKGLKNGP